MALTGRTDVLPPPWVPVAGALLGVGAHLVNALPDLADDAATGVRGLPHRLGARWTPPVATTVLVLASVLIAWPPHRPGDGRRGRAWPSSRCSPSSPCAAAGRTPFRAAMGIALVDVALLAGAR